MGRFYKTASPEFVEDIIYQPPWDLMKESLQIQQKEYDTQMATAELLGNVDIKHIDDTRENETVKNKLAYYADASANMAEQMRNASGKDWRKNMPDLQKLRREVTEDFQTGDISKIQNSAAAYAQMEKELEGITDASTKEAYKNKFIKDWRANPDRSLDQVFTSKPMYDKKDLMDEFIKDLEKSDPDQAAYAKAYAKGDYLYEFAGTSESKTKLDEQYAQFIKGHGYEDYLNSRQELGKGEYFDANGKLKPFTDPTSPLHAESQYAKTFEYKKDTATGNIQADHALTLQAREHAFQRWAKSLEVPATPISFDKDASFNYNYTSDGRKVVEAYKKALQQITPGAKTPKESEKMIEMYRANPTKYPTQYAKIQSLDAKYNASMTSGTEGFRKMGGTAEQLKIISEKMAQPGNEKVLSNKPGIFDFGEYGGQIHFSKGAMDSTGKRVGDKTNVNQMIGQYVTVMENGKPVPRKIKNCWLEEGSTSYTPAANLSDKGELQSGTQSTAGFQLEGSDQIIYADFHVGGDPLNFGF